MIGKRILVCTAAATIALVGDWSWGQEPAAQSTANAPQAAGEYRVLRGPGGKELVEVPMPAGFKPIRLVGLRGLPVTGYPVTSRLGELNPQNWEQLNLGEIDVDFRRVLGALRLRSEPKLLQGLSYAEEFARIHLDEPTAETFFSTPGAKKFGSNEFERKALFEQFLATHEEPLRDGLPGLPFEFVYIEQALLGTYDEARGAFGISNTSGDSETISILGFSGALAHANTPRVDVPGWLPMTPVEAQALLERVPDARGPAGRAMNAPPIRYIYRKLRLSITGFAVARNGQTDTELEVRSVGLFEDPLLERPIHEYVIETQVAQGTISPSGSLLLPHLPNLYAMRDIDGWLDDEGIARSTKYLVNLEQALNASPFNRGQGPLCKDKLSVFEWATARPELANGPLLDVLMDPDPDWSFLDEETRYGLVADHCVEVLVFPREKIAGRPVDFAASELAPVYRRTLEAATGRLPDTVYINRRLPAPTYDHARQVLTFEAPAGAGYGATGQPAQMLGGLYRGVEYLAPGEAPKSKSAAVVHAPEDAEGLAFYGLESAVSDNERITPAPLQPASTSGGEHSEHGSPWRNSVRWFRGDRGDEPNALAVDRLLVFPSIPADPATAERWIAEMQSGYATAPRAVIVLAIDGMRTVGPGHRPVLFTRLKQVTITTHDGREIAAVDAESFPDAVATYRANLAGQRAEQDAAASAAAAKKEADRASADQARAAREAELAACDADSSTAQDRLACYQAVCKARAGDYECFKQVQHARTRVYTEQAGAAAQSATQRSSCTLRARRKWRLTEASGDYERVVANCMAQTEREAYGPNIIGLRLGMERNDVDLVRLRELDIAETTKSRQLRRAEESVLFDEGTVYFSADKRHFLAVFNLYNFGQPLAAVIGRRMYFGESGRPVESLMTPMRRKYGDPVWQDDRHFLWTFDRDGKPGSGASVRSCAGLASLLSESQWNTFSGRDEEISRLGPPMISTQASRADYSAFSDCGVVLIARMRKLSNGAVGDAALVLFDPAWIAEQPDIAFNDPARDEDLRF